MNIAFGALGHSNTMILWISVFGKELSKRRDASVRLKTRGIDVERRIPSVRRETSALGQKPVGLETRPPSEERPASHSSEAAPAEGCAAFPATEAQAPAGSTPDLPEFAKKADDLEAIKQAVDDAASVGGSLWLSYLFVLFYLAVAAGAVTHTDLFLENPVKLPFLNIELPLLAFFFLAPILFIIVHAYTLVHLVLLTDKAKRFYEALHRQIGEGEGHSQDELERRRAIRDGLERQLPSNIFVQFLAGPEDVRDGAFGFALRAIAWITLVIAPVLLLLLMQIQFLPFHSFSITWAHRLALLADLLLIWWLWREILSGRGKGGQHRAASWSWASFGLLSACALLLSWTTATFPGESQDNRLAGWRVFATSDILGRPIKVSLHDWLFNSKVDSTTRRRWFPFSSTLVLSGLNIYEGLKLDDPDKAKWHDFVFRARGRDLKGAILDYATLSRVDFEGAELQGASLNGAQLQGADLFTAQLQGARVRGAELQGARLDFASLEGAWLDSSAQLQGASLVGAQLQGASFSYSNLEGASLNGAQLQGAQLDGTILRATDLSEANLWRSVGPTRDAPVALRLSADRWLPSARDIYGKVQPFDQAAYLDLRKMVVDSLPANSWRDAAASRIDVLDCSKTDSTLIPCDAKSASGEPSAWRKSLEDAEVGDSVYIKALAVALKALVCSGKENTIYVLRGIVKNKRVAATSAAAPALVDSIMSNDCPVSASLIGDDKAMLLRVKEDAIEKPGG